MTYHTQVLIISKSNIADEVITFWQLFGVGGSTTNNEKSQIFSNLLARLIPKIPLLFKKISRGGCAPIPVGKFGIAKLHQGDLYAYKTSKFSPAAGRQLQLVSTFCLVVTGTRVEGVT